MKKNKSDKELNGFVVGGQTILGKPHVMAQAIDEADPKKQAYHPNRDVLQFFPELVLRAVKACQLRAIPAVDDKFKADKHFEAKVVGGVHELFAVISAAKGGTYLAAMENWLAAVDDEVAEFIISLFGRAILEFYFCCLLQVKELGVNGSATTDKIYEQLVVEARRYKKCQKTNRVSAGRWSTFCQRCAALWKKLLVRWGTKTI